MILHWLLDNFPGGLQEDEEMVCIRHDNGDTSTLWKWREPEYGDLFPSCLDGFFSKFEAADLLSSTFKISSPRREIIRNGVPIVCSQPELQRIVHREGVLFSPENVPFMTQAGGWVYAYSADPNSIWEWDLEYPPECRKYKHLLDILEEWNASIQGE